MTIIVLTNCPATLRGFLTRWLLEISPGVFLGGPSDRIRRALWEEVKAYSGQGRALLAYSDAGEQGYALETNDHKWHPVNHEGLTLIRRPKDGQARTATAVPAKGWSKAAKRRRFGGR
ncbi:type I-E CRISPR-associated endoribonuclease Cas2e [Streptomyces halstedii]|uniref:type I-E CRISPR-associated endoribonuclease Cas2e n=1 Tax=Streptomyces halstedii TaxID=1944 RepID=UPI0036963207